MCDPVPNDTIPVQAEKSALDEIGEEAGSAAAGESGSIEPTDGAVTAAPSEAAGISTTHSGIAESSPESEFPNVVSAAVAPTTGPGSASSAAGADTGSPIAVNSVETPLAASVAFHLEAIYRLVKQAAG